MFQYEGANFKCQSALYAKNIKPPGFVLLEDYVTQPTGSIAGTFSISDSGQAQYTVPLVLPPGRAGMSPFLSLAYNSAGGNGDVGLGWSLTGLPKIASCAETIAQDGMRVASATSRQPLLHRNRTTQPHFVLMVLDSFNCLERSLDNGNTGLR